MEIDRRLGGVPELRRVIFRPAPLAGPPLWIDDPAFRIDRHVTRAELPPPGDDAALLALAERLLAPRLDRSRPLWRMWFVTGLTDGRIGVLIVLHHALADGMTAMRLVRGLLHGPVAPSLEQPNLASRPVPAPKWVGLVRENVARKLATAERMLHPETWRRIADVARSSWRASSLMRGTSRSSLNAPVGPRRRLATVRLDRVSARRVARAHGVGTNDVVLDLVAGGVRALLGARGEPVGGMRVRAGVAVALFNPERGMEAGNDIGTLLVPLELGVADPVARLRSVGVATKMAERSQVAAEEPVVRAWIGRFGFVRHWLERQRLVNLAETYLPGPPLPTEILGARVAELLPIAPLSGNVGLSFVAFSYAGTITLAIRADADRFPDLDVLVAAVEQDWRVLTGSAAFGRPRPRV
jgi:diacylglycerol O-acyltransferase